MEPQATLNDLGIDWLSATAPLELMQTEWAVVMQEVFEKERLRGNRERDARILGYIGRQCGRCFQGSRADGVFVRFSGEAANRWFWWINQPPLKATRLDIQTTWEFAQADAQRLGKWAIQAGRQNSANGRKARITELRVDGQVQTLYCGARSSERFGRIYDKGLEQGTEEAGRLIRFEVEYKGGAAQYIASMLLVTSLVDERIHDTVGLACDSWGIPYPSLVRGEALIYHTPHEAADVEKSLKWLSGPVASVVQQVTLEVGPERVLHALFSKMLSLDVEASDVLAILEGLVS